MIIQADEQVSFRRYNFIQIQFRKIPFFVIGSNCKWSLTLICGKKLLVARVSAVVFENTTSFFSLAFLKVAKEISSFLAYHFLSI